MFADVEDKLNWVFESLGDNHEGINYLEEGKARAPLQSPCADR